MNGIKQLIVLSLSLLAAPSFAQPKGAVYLDDKKPIEERIEDALSRMTLEEKLAMCHAQSKFSSAGVPRLGIPEVWCSDGPHGIRAEVYWDEWNTAGWTNDCHNWRRSRRCQLCDNPKESCKKAQYKPEYYYL